MQLLLPQLYQDRITRHASAFFAMSSYAAVRYKSLMSIRLPFACLAVGHRPDRKRAWYDNLDWRSNCKYCEAPLIRTDNGWRGFKSSDMDPGRCSKDEALLSQQALLPLPQGSDKSA